MPVQQVGASDRHAPGPAALDPLLGWVPPDNSWAPAVRYLLRRARILPLVDPACGGRALEVGCGAGALLVDLCDRGYACTGLEQSDPALRVAHHMIASSGREVDLYREPQPSWDGQFDLLAAFDVLEHIEGDAGALRQWSRWMSPRGTLLVSVPAHPSRWGAGDVWAGHFRRYSKSELLRLLKSCGFEPEIVECYGFPLANLTEWLGNFYYRRALRRRGPAHDRQQGNALSGVDRTAYVRAMSRVPSWLSRLTVRAGAFLQSAFIDTDLGSGYLVLARKT